MKYVDVYSNMTQTVSSNMESNDKKDNSVDVFSGSCVKSLYIGGETKIKTTADNTLEVTTKYSNIIVKYQVEQVEPRNNILVSTNAKSRSVCNHKEANPILIDTLCTRVTDVTISIDSDSTDSPKRIAITSNFGSINIIYVGSMPMPLTGFVFSKEGNIKLTQANEEGIAMDNNDVQKLSGINCHLKDIIAESEDNSQYLYAGSVRGNMQL